MATIELGCQLDYQVEFETSFIFQIAALDSARQHIVQEILTCQPQQSIEVCRVGQLDHRVHRMVVQPGPFNLMYTATVETQPAKVPSADLQAYVHSRLPCKVLEFLNPSRYCESDKLEHFAWDTFGHTPAGHARVQAVTDWVNSHLSYTPGSTGPTTTACDVFLLRQGVCRDFAHVTIALCRALGMPARYVAGYAVKLDPPDFHGFVEVFLDGDWYLFDATKLAPVDGFVRIGAGRDAADLSFATLVGNTTMNQIEVWARDTGAGMSTGETGNDTAVSLN
ncbi:MAG: transglutaminase family protein [Granulosicoccus sp.]|nr:transglutaminase family protein [Granulosicoccus sp.]